VYSYNIHKTDIQTTKQTPGIYYIEKENIFFCILIYKY